MVVLLNGFVKVECTHTANYAHLGGAVWSVWAYVYLYPWPHTAMSSTPKVSCAPELSSSCPHQPPRPRRALICVLSPWNTLYSTCKSSPATLTLLAVWLLPSAVVCVRCSPLSLLTCIPRYGCTVGCWSSHSLKDTWWLPFWSAHQ